MTETIKLDDIMVGSRLRKDYGNLDDLDSIADVGLIQPLVLNLIEGRPTLVAGGRRLAKLREIGVQEVWHGITCDPTKAGFVYADELPVDVRREIELYENIGRKPMTWKERVISIAQIHKLKLKRAALNRESWGLRETGAELGMDFSNVSWMVRIAEELENPESKIHDCTNSTEAIRFFVELREAKALKDLTLLTVPKTQSSAETPVIEINSTGEIKDELVVPLSRMLLHGDMEEILETKLETESVDHIVTDWPYGIDMAYLDQGKGIDVSRVEEEHDVTANLQAYKSWLWAMFRVLKPGGYCIIWYDNVNWQLIRDEAEMEGYGFRVQRWPLVWIKTSPCLNQMANKNFTKATEFAIVLSKGNSFLANTQSTNYWSGPRSSSTSNPFAKPKGLWQWIYSAICVKGHTVLDPFAGEGSSTLAAIDYGLRPIAIESNENHYNQLVSNVREKYTSLTQGKVKFE